MGCADQCPAGNKKHQIENAEAPKKCIVTEMPTERAVLVDMSIFDVPMKQI